MLQELYIKDFALIREQRITFSPGLNLLTGETGAGKSIILGALGLVLGDKATTDLIRTGRKRAVVEASFYLDKTDKGLFDKLQDHGLEVDDDRLLILKREISVEGKGRSFINASQVPVSLLKKVGSSLVDIHGQNEHQSIMQTSTHRAILDRYANLVEDVAELRALYHQREELKQKVVSVSLDETEKNRRLEILKHEINEIESASLQEVREFEDLLATEKSLANAETILKELEAAHMALSEREGAVSVQASFILKVLERNAQFDESLNPALNQFRDAYYLIEDVAIEVRRRIESISVDPEQLNQVRERIDLLQTLFRKYGSDIAAVKQYLEKARNEYDGIELSGEQEKTLRKQIADVEDKLVKVAVEVSKKRREKARELEESIKKELEPLGMADTRVRISIRWEYGENGLVESSENQGKKYVIHPNGLDLVEFLISASEKESLRPLKKVASGGEMSRIMLALKKVVIDSDPVHTMVFDEVDAGVGGRIAEAVGNRLNLLAKSSQVFVITHLHQIAALNDNNTVHFKVTKSNEGTKINRLNKEQRVQELARMIGGENISSTALEHARNLLNVK